MTQRITVNIIYVENKLWTMNCYPSVLILPNELEYTPGTPQEPVSHICCGKAMVPRNFHNFQATVEAWIKQVCFNKWMYKDWELVS